MITLKPLILDPTGWLEATWIDEEKQVQCTSYHPTQIDILRADAAKHGTSLDEYEDIISEWIASYIPPDPNIETPVVINPVTPRQIRMALTRVGLRQQVEDAVAAGNQDLKDWWEFSTEFIRNHPQVISLAELLTVPSDQVDALWILAGSL